MLLHGAGIIAKNSSCFNILWLTYMWPMPYVFGLGFCWRKVRFLPTETGFCHIGLNRQKVVKTKSLYVTLHGMKIARVNNITQVVNHWLFGHICRSPRHTPVWQALHLSIDASTGTPPAADWKHPPGRPRRTWLQQVEEDMGLPISAANSRPWTARCGDRYDPQLVKRSSEWVSG